MLNTTDKIIKHKTGLLNLAEELGNVSKACQVMGYSRDTFYRYKSAVEDGGVEALFERKRPVSALLRGVAVAVICILRPHRPVLTRPIQSLVHVRVFARSCFHCRSRVLH